jgi:hypothetical protein
VRISYGHQDLPVGEINAYRHFSDELRGLDMVPHAVIRMPAVFFTRRWEVEFDTASESPSADWFQPRQPESA